MLIDSFGRALDYLRVSVTDRCNLRCVYCMPAAGVEWRPHETMLTFEEIIRVCRIMAEMGIKKIKVTGGEPLVRRGVSSLVKSLKAISGIEKVTMTTNGLLWDRYQDGGVAPDGVNISLDALSPERFRRITLHEGPPEILPVIDSLLEKRVPVKLNCVPVRSFNEAEILPLAALARDREIAVRFIELMPLGSASALQFIPGNEIASLLEKAYGALREPSGLASDTRIIGNGPAIYYSLPGFAGKIGFINPMSRGFCETCNRLRLTSEGFLKLCLSTSAGLDLRALLRSGAADEDIAGAVTGAVAKKPRFHNFFDVSGSPGGSRTNGMFRIGG